ncbi:hypothetical protein CF319_g8473 [Tilletia indica]|nr:hypothetical protein CF319_g8473 [Tilletia indica]
MQTAKQAKTEFRQLESSIRHSPAQRKQKEQQYNLSAQRVKQAELAQQEAEEHCAASLRSLFLSFGGVMRAGVVVAGLPSSDPRTRTQELTMRSMRTRRAT